MRNMTSKLLLGAVGLLAAYGPALADQAVGTVSEHGKMTAVHLAESEPNDSTMIRVPPKRKTSGFSAEAVQSTDKVARNSVQAIYASHEA